MEVGGGGVIYLSLNCQHQNDSEIKMCCDESHFNVTRQSPQTTTFLKTKESQSGIQVLSAIPAFKYAS